MVLLVVVASKIETCGGRTGRWKLSGTTVVRLCCFVAASRSWRRRLGWWRELTVELVLLLAGSCCRSWRGERELDVLQWRRKRERGCYWRRDKDELALSTLVAGVAVVGVWEDDGWLIFAPCLSTCSFIIFLYYFHFVTQKAFCKASHRCFTNCAAKAVI